MLYRPPVKPFCGYIIGDLKILRAIKIGNDTHMEQGCRGLATEFPELYIFQPIFPPAKCVLCDL